MMCSAPTSPSWPTVRSPRRRSPTPSSGGEDGSIRGPAARCGIVGLKPTYGLVSRRGVVALSWSLDHVGPMTRTVHDAAVLLQAIAGHDPGDPSTRDARVADYTAPLETGVRGLKLGLLRRFYVDFPGLHADVK